MFHDVGELVTGDPPYPIKARNPVLKAEMDRLEAEGVSHMDLPPNLMEPDEALHWKQRIKICDVLEMWEFLMDEVALGNSFCRFMVDDMARLRINLTQQYRFPDDEIVRIQRYMNDRSRRQP